MGAFDVGPIITWIAVDYEMGFAKPMLICTTIALVSFVCALLLGPETKGRELVSDLEIRPLPQV